MILKPCPFCGGEAEVECVGTRRASCVVVCTECGARHEGPDEGDASGSRWNEREPEYVPGEWVCDACGFVLCKNILYAQTGNVGADNSEAETPCPNEGTAMRRVTVMEALNESRALAGKLMIEANRTKE